MKKSSIILIIIVLGVFLFTISVRKKRVESTEVKHTQFLTNRSINKTLQLSKEERLAKGLPPNKYLEEKYLLEINPHTGRSHPENLYKVQQELKEKRAKKYRTPGDGVDNQWTERGPNNVGGRTRVVMYDPNDNNNKRVFAGGVSGGLWVNNDITDVNSSWTRVGIDENLSVTCMAVDPNNSQIMYIGTGELYSPQKALGNGIWKSTDGGATWSNVYKLRGATTKSSTIEVSGTYYMTDIIVRDKDGSSATTNDSEVFAAIGGSFYSSNPINTFIGRNDYGIFKSADNGTSWSQITLDVNGNPVAPNDFELSTDNTLWLGTTRNMYGDGGGRIYSSADGTSFTLKHTIPDGRRTEIAVSKLNANTVYVLGRVYTLDGSNEFTAPYVSLLKTTDAFATLPTALSLPNDATVSIPANDFTRGQAFYNLVIEVDPNNDAIAYAGGINLFRTTDSGVSWSQISKNTPTGTLPGITVSYVHSDQHCWAFHPTDSNIAVSGNDGGVFYISSLSGASSSDTVIEERTKDYITTQFYHAAISQTIVPEYLVGGTQDNGVLLFDEATSGINSATKVLRGDGTRCFIDKEGGYMIVSRLYNNIFRYNLPYTGTSVTVESDNATGGFINAMDLDENLDILYTNGNNHLARFTNIASGTPNRTNITDPLLVNISAIKVSPYTSASSKVFLGTRSGKVLKVENANTATQTITDISSASFLGNISSIEFGANENEIMVTFYNFGVESIWFTDDGGTTWSNKEGDFPDINVRCILMNPLNNHEVIIGTELGVWYTSNFKDVSPNWNQAYNGMSNVAVLSFDLRTVDNTILAATHGRGMYTGKFKDNDATTWTGATDTDWTKTGNWTDGVPTKILDVVIPNTSNKPIINTDINVGNLSIEASAALTIEAQGSLTVREDLTNNGTLTINSSTTNSGSLIVQQTSTGNVIYNRYVTANWHLISSPVIGQDYDNIWVSNNLIASGNTNTNQRGIATYNNNTGSWNYMLKDESSTFALGAGYSTLRTTSGNLSFTGKILTNDNIKPITKGTTNPFNLIGNVYAAYIPLNIDANTTHNFLTKNTDLLEESTVWLWNGSSYNPINHAAASQFIAPGQGFFVRSKPSGNNVLFTKEMQSNQTVAFLKNQKLRPEIRLFLSNGKVKKYADIFYINSTTEGFDNGYDSSLYSGVSNSFEIFTKLTNNEKDMNLAIQSIPQDYTIVIPIGIIASANTEININLTAKNIDKNVYLEDKELGVFTLMNDEKTTYTFTSTEAINGAGRFFLHTTSETLSMSNTNLSNSHFYYADDKIHFSNLPSGKKEVAIYDVLGKLILSKNITIQSAISIYELPKAVYVVRLKTEKGTIQKKIQK